MSDPLGQMFRMPVGFGPAPGPRNLPASQRHRRFDKKATSLTLSAVTDAEPLAALLPDRMTLVGEPRLEVVVTLLSDVGWLAGRGYNIVMVRIPARWNGEQSITGHFVPVVWENMADPILTGREELGWPKIFAEIPEPDDTGSRLTGSARWDGFEFLQFMAEDLEPIASPMSAAAPMIFRKYIPRTGEWGRAEIDHMTIVEPGPPVPEIRSCQAGSGRFSFTGARWEDMPTQYPIVNALAALPLHAFGPAVLLDTSGGSDVSEQRTLR
ncbi:acetoacetate decarboxylase family protein [Croceibacterium sp. LX-88]|uniref:Acetoacetate decarboxylase family protein n=1 Tax=Croceibacterium selenioxidans TaxID=2838833 RepID=A0ABS5W6H4_9SPHN|nr:acetoacetate decarboxylase family protein [Croceibacterium selenioxidans]MBT2135350.1 acetoacetate decarboxylase family protein [Croceibacterium selenioxidans]